MLGQVSKPPAHAADPFSQLEATRLPRFQASRLPEPRARLQAVRVQAFRLPDPRILDHRLPGSRIQYRGHISYVSLIYWGTRLPGPPKEGPLSWNLLALDIYKNKRRQKTRAENGGRKWGQKTGAKVKK